MSLSDELFHLFVENLEDCSNLEESGHELIERVVEDYLDQLKRRGVIPAYALEDLVEDLQIEVIEMYRKKTYGHFDLRGYRLRKRAM